MNTLNGIGGKRRRRSTFYAPPQPTPQPQQLSTRRQHSLPQPYVADAMPAGVVLPPALACSPTSQPTNNSPLANKALKTAVRNLLESPDSACK